METLHNGNITQWKHYTMETLHNGNITQWKHYTMETFPDKQLQSHSKTTCKKYLTFHLLELYKS